MAVVEAQLSGYVPVGVLFDAGHVGVLDRAAEVFKLQLQAWRFLYARGAGGEGGGGRSLGVSVVIREMWLCVND